MSDPDPGDEDREAVDGTECPFCRRSFVDCRRWQTPLFGPTRQSFTEAMKLDVGKIGYEALTTCDSEQCRAQAREMSIASRQYEQEREVNAHLAWLRGDARLRYRLPETRT